MMNMEKEQRAIEYLRMFEPQDEPYYLCYSGGKDSDCIRILAQLAGVRHDIVHNHTTVDAPETVRYVRSIPDVIIDYPDITMWELIPEKKMPPTRLMRYCCEVLKERGGRGRRKIMGVRRAESVNRKQNGGLIKIVGKPKTVQRLADELGIAYEVNPKGGIVIDEMVFNGDNSATREFVEDCYRTTSTMINPIVDWTDADVWEFLQHYGCESNPLYQCGHKRVGCVGCPMQNGRHMRKEFSEYPKYRNMYVRAFDRMLAVRQNEGLPTEWQTGEDVMRWWTEDVPRNQLSMFEEVFI